MPTVTLKSLSADLASGRTTSRRLVEDCLEAILCQSEDGPAFLHVDPDKARSQAEAMDLLRKGGAQLSAFAGIPVSVKDLFDVAGETTRAGSRVLQDSPPAARDAEAVARLRRAGFVIIGRTNMSEFAFSGLGLNPHFGTPLTPWDEGQRRISGGSSSGAAISVVKAMAHAGLGTDTGGSCRIPAAFTGLVGYKPTANRIPRDGAIPLSTTLDAVGTIARSVACCETLDAVLSGDAERSPWNGRVDDLRLAAIGGLPLANIDPEVARVYDQALARLSSAGARVFEVEIPEFDGIAAINSKGGFTAAESYSWHKNLLQTKAAVYDPRIRARIERGALQSAADYIEITEARQNLVADATRKLSGYDAFLMPTTPILPPRLAELEDDDAFARINLLALRNPAIVNMIDGCSISIPIHAADAPPVGLMISGCAGQDLQLLKRASRIAEVLGCG